VYSNFINRYQRANRKSKRCVCRKEAEISSLNTKLESEQSLVAQLQKKIKELQVSERVRFRRNEYFVHHRQLLSLRLASLTFLAAVVFAAKTDNKFIYLFICIFFILQSENITVKIKCKKKTN